MVPDARHNQRATCSSLPFRLSATFAVLLLSSTALADPKLYVFDCGSLNLNDVSVFGLAADETPVRELFVPCYLVQHEQGLLFWDGGLPLSVAEADGPVSVGDDGTMAYERSVIEQLADMGIVPA